MNYTTETMMLAVAAFLALLGAAFAHDHLFAIHMGILSFCLVAGTCSLSGRSTSHRRTNGGKWTYRAISTKWSATA